MADTWFWTVESMTEGMAFAMSIDSRVNEEVVLTAFRLLDVNGDGRLNMDDITRILGQVAATFRSASESALAEYTAAVQKMFGQILCYADEDGDGSISSGEYVEFYRNAPRHEIDKMSNEIAKCLFAVADSDGDGVISRSEFERHLAGLDTSGKYAQYFDEFSDNADGMSREHYVTFMRIHFLGG